MSEAARSPRILIFLPWMLARFFYGNFFRLLMLCSWVAKASRWPGLTSFSPETGWIEFVDCCCLPGDSP